MAYTGRARLLRGLVAVTGIDSSLLRGAGTTVFGGEDRAGSGRFAAYWVGERALLWADPALVDRLAVFRSDTEAVDRQRLRAWALDAGFTGPQTSLMRVLDGDIAAVAPPPGPYRQERLAGDSALFINRIRSLTQRCDRDEVEEAGLGELDDFNELAVNTVSYRGELVAYASAALWDWDDGLADVGVLVDPAHRGRQLGSIAVVNTCRELLAADLQPLYRHAGDNEGSARLSVALGFEAVLELDVFRQP